MSQVGSIVTPFGPSIYLGTIDEKYIVEMEQAIEKSRMSPEEYDARATLAGRIEEQLQILPHVSEACLGHIYSHAHQYMESCGGEPAAVLPDTEIDALWTNIQRYMETNPWHSHGGLFSFVIFINNELDREETINNKYDSARGTNLAGHLEFRFGEDAFWNWNSYQLWPERGGIVMFPNWLHHYVHPHYDKDKVRISVAGNIAQIGIEQRDYIKGYESS